MPLLTFQDLGLRDHCAVANQLDLQFRVQVLSQTPGPREELASHSANTFILAPEALVSGDFPIRLLSAQILPCVLSHLLTQSLEIWAM